MLRNLPMIAFIDQFETNNLYGLNSDSALQNAIAEAFNANILNAEHPIPKAVLHQILQLTFSFAARIYISFNDYKLFNFKMHDWKMETLLDAYKHLNAIHDTNNAHGLKQKIIRLNKCVTLKISNLVIYKRDEPNVDDYDSKWISFMKKRGNRSDNVNALLESVFNEALLHYVLAIRIEYDQCIEILQIVNDSKREHFLDRLHTLMEEKKSSICKIGEELDFVKTIQNIVSTGKLDFLKTQITKLDERIEAKIPNWKINNLLFLQNIEHLEIENVKRNFEFLAS
uniref:Uncharacterized protein n=1 Tax=Globodera pallida TaxID=36090 RepID=A0A183C3A8_GLOPA